MTERIRRMKSHIDALNAAGVRRTSLYALAYSSLRLTRGEPTQIRRAKAEAFLLDHAALAVHPYELIAGSLSAFCPVAGEEENEESLLARARETIRDYLPRRGENGEARKQGVRTFEQDFTEKRSRWALMSRVYHDGSVSYRRLQWLISSMKQEFEGVEGLEGYEIARELERAFKLEYGEAKREMEALPWFPANHLNLSYETALDAGLRGLEARMRAGETRAQSDEQKEYYAAARIVLAAAQRFILRYANAVSGEASRSAGGRNRELSGIAETLRRLSTEPAAHFYDGIQLTWILHIMMSILGGSALSFGRFDQYLGARYERDLRSGAITEEEARELLGCLWLKINEPMLRTVQSLTLGGVDPDGNDAANALTRLCLEVTREMKLPYPNVGLRINRANPDWLLETAADSILRGAGQPMLMNDDIWIENLKRIGHRPGDANNYYHMGCVEIMVPGSMPNWGVTDPVAFPMLIHQTLERYKRGKPALDTFDQFMRAYKDEVERAVRKRHAEAKEKIADIPGKCFDPFASLLVRGCLESGMDLMQGGSRLGAHWSFYAYGLGTATDALMAVKQWVYDKKEISLEKLSEVLEQNFSGAEPLRRRLSHAPHYGNDDDGADAIARDILQCFDDAVFACNTDSGRNKFVSTLFGYFFHIYHGEITPATPNGRRRGEPFSDSMGPSQGMDVNGPTAMLNSVLKLDHSKVTGGYALNLKLNPELARGDKGRQALYALVKAYFQGGGPQIQLNLVDADTLRDARAHPEKHGDLIVRIGGYCEYFVHLDAALQEEIIQRTVHGF